MPARALARGPLLLVYALSRQSGQLLATCFEGAPLTPDDFAVYSALRLVAPATPSSLASTLGMRQSTLSGYLRRMEQRQHLARRRHPHDGRSALIALTAAGTRVTEACFPHFQEAISPLLERLGDDGPEVLAAMERLSVALDEVIAAVGRDRDDGDGAAGDTAVGE